MNLFKPSMEAAVAAPLRRRSSASDAAWARLEPVSVDVAGLRRKRVVTIDRADPAHMPFDMLRTQLLQTMRDRGWLSLAVTSPGPACGKTLTCLNLAFSFARQRKARILLVELDLRRPALAGMLGATPRRPVGDLLSGRAAAEEALARVGDGLAMAFADGPVANPAELLHDPSTLESLDAMVTALEPDLVIYDLPPMLVSDDAAAFLAHADCAMLIAAANETELKDIERCESQMEALTEVLGIVLNKCEFTPKIYYGYTNK